MLEMLERNRAAFWPWLLLIAVMVSVAYFACQAGRTRQDAHDAGARDQRGGVVSAQPPQQPPH